MIQIKLKCIILTDCSVLLKIIIMLVVLSLKEMEMKLGGKKKESGEKMWPGVCSYCVVFLFLNLEISKDMSTFPFIHEEMTSKLIGTCLSSCSMFMIHKKK